MNLTSRSQIILAAAIILLFFVGILFYYLNRATTRLDTPMSLPSNESFQVINADGNVEDINSAGGLFGDTSAESEEVSTQIRRIAAGPIAGVRLIENAFGNSVRYIESDTGYVYDYLPNTNTTTRLTTTTLPRIVKAIWVGDETVLIQYDESERSINYLATVNIADGVLEGVIFPNNLVSIIGANDRIYYLLRDNRGSSLYRYNPNTKESTFMLALDLADLHLQKISNQPHIILAITKPHGDIAQAAIAIDTQANTSVVLDNPVNFTSGTVVTDQARLFIQSDQMIAYNLETESQNLIQGHFLSQKCGTSSLQGDEIICAESILRGNESRNWPTNWLRGQIAPNERLIAIEPDFGSWFDLFELGDGYDVDEILVDSQNIYFTSRKNGGLFLAPRTLGY